MVKQALAAYVEREAERYRLTLEALADVDANDGISEADAKAWTASLSTSQPEGLAG